MIDLGRMQRCLEQTADASYVAQWPTPNVRCGLHAEKAGPVRCLVGPNGDSNLRLSRSIARSDAFASWCKIRSTTSALKSFSFRNQVLTVLRMSCKWAS